MLPGFVLAHELLVPSWPLVEWQSIANFDVLARNGDGLLWYPGDSDGYHVDNEGTRFRGA